MADFSDRHFCLLFGTCCIELGADDLGKSELDRFIDTTGESGDIFYHPSEGYLSEEYPSPKRRVRLGRYDRSDGREVYPWLREGESAGDIDVDIVALELEVAPLGQDCEQEIELSGRDPAGRAFRIAEFGIRGERFDLDEYRAVPLHGERESRSGEFLVLGIDELYSGIFHILESRFGHTEESDLIGRSESILERAKYAVVLVPAPLEEEDSIDEVLEDFRS